jgi:hypothetical protein
VIRCNYFIFTEVKYENCRTVSNRKYCTEKAEQNMLVGLLIMGLWAALAVYCFWYFFTSKTVQPLTLDELALIWQLHKQHTGCTSSRIHSLIESNNEVVGFKCDCGYEFKQRRLITQRISKPHSDSKLATKSLRKTAKVKNH